MAEVAAVEDAHVLVLQAGGQTSRIRLAGVQRAGSEIVPEAPGRQEEQEHLVCQLGDTGCAQTLGAEVPRQSGDQCEWNQRARAFLEGLVKGRRVRVVFIESDAAAGPRLALLYRASDGLFVNSALVRQGRWRDSLF
jgi:endonuclease YncB( thermonuclease family)